MLILGSLNSNKTELLIEKYAELVESGVKLDEIIFIALNSQKREKIKKRIKFLLPNHEKPNIQTFLGLCYNGISDCWEELQELLPQKSVRPLTLCGLEVSQNILQNCIKEAGFKDYNSKINLTHQLLRRHALIVNNNLTDEEVKKKSLMLNETFAPEAKKALDLFKAKTLELRAFDYIRQQTVFKYIYQKTSYFSKIKYVFVDDYDEQTQACIDFVEYLSPALKERFIGIDRHGASKFGYLCANINAFEYVKNEKEKIKAKEKKNNISNVTQSKNFSKRTEMLYEVINDARKLVGNGVLPEEISIVTPVFDNQLKFTLKEEFEKAQIPCQFISGSEKLVDYPLVKTALSALRLINNIEAGEDDVKNIFSNLLEIPLRHCFDILKGYKKNKGFINYKFEDENFNTKYAVFLELPKNIKPSQKLHEQLLLLYSELIILRKNSAEDIKNFDFLSKQIKDLETTLQDEISKEQIITRLENTIISENDSQSGEFTPQGVTVATAQKLIDLEIRSKHQLLLDTTSEQWVQQDCGTLYNAWVMQKSWTKSEFTYEDGIESAKEKTKRVLRKLTLLAQGEIALYASSQDSLGIENNSGILKYFRGEEKTAAPSAQQTFIPRDDQKAVLEYESGKLAISAVPGAGKTTVLQALAAKMISDGTKPESIYVLTYMEAAAKNIKERIMTAYPDFKTYPNITTIHGLALRIIKENANFAKLGLDENFEICDELQRQKFIQETITEFKYNWEEYDKWEKAISTAKFVEKNSSSKSPDVKGFSEFFKHYNKKLAQNNLIDYDDMLILAVELLEKNPEILSYYQNQCQYIIEDEAQDSSSIQQKLISLLGGKYNNIVRCGDFNQTITSTFTNSDVSGFKKFIAQNNSIYMTSSQRCAEGIYVLANNLIDFSQTLPEGKNAFLNAKIQEVKGKNPISQDTVQARGFDTPSAEKDFITAKIGEILSNNPGATIAILLRNNYQVNEYSAMVAQNGFEVISRTDCLSLKTIFTKILSILTFLENPWDNSFVVEVYNEIIKEKSNADLGFLENLETPFLNCDITKLRSKNLINLHWELDYWLMNSTLPMEGITLKIGNYYCQSEIDRANLFVIAEIIRRISKHSKANKEIISKFQALAKRPSINGLKLFSENDNTIKNHLGGKVQIMTMHKSKGDEFDCVFVPELTENNLGMSPENVRAGEYWGFFEDIKSLDNNYKRKNINEVKREIIEENLRLLYVAITRAKLSLFLTSAQKYKKFGRLKDAEKSVIFKTLLASKETAAIS